mmetsp:Transcript_21982/g.77085  ORF Transcript_21982/g.77085 Transcript_21982/m.77085 type:complete len:143 (-) Transcript_21982:205-633(-)|eukprot:CAMPEP_0203809570 /NCGR_PEP_ID=MMETSP0115-20131106/2363_1 /ASSEMBLY_ACC=CAM_ASM_000227 /TAXON_ID=33651 /ORGANISM="Bicosoecid sp, Strain ms1" /LENGTH=142 /DNA_ID=CAMNT_0050718309 /DNA_START=74 /DNA_END=502 /DNA_ORIENTATION=+
MPKNKGKGGKNRRRGKKGDGEEKRELEFREDGQQYAKVLKMLGNCRVEAYCYDGVKRMCHIRGNMRKKVWVVAGDIVLVAPREFEDSKADIIHKFTNEEALKLKQFGELPENAKISEGGDVGEDGAAGDDDDGDFEFDVDDI